MLDNPEIGILDNGDADVGLFMSLLLIVSLITSPGESAILTPVGPAPRYVLVTEA
jgi:hypothetical protein